MLLSIDPIVKSSTKKTINSVIRSLKVVSHPAELPPLAGERWILRFLKARPPLDGRFYRV